MLLQELDEREEVVPVQPTLVPVLAACQYARGSATVDADYDIYLKHKICRRWQHECTYNFTGCRLDVATITTPSANKTFSVVPAKDII
jgi:hypothetical protein